jgi:hypothetical protein
MADDSTIPLTSQVGGHAGVRSSSDGSQIMKPCLTAERQFYETVVSKDVQGFKLLAKHVPKFYGIEPAAVGVEGAKDEFFLYFLYFDKLDIPDFVWRLLGLFMYFYILFHLL